MSDINFIYPSRNTINNTVLFAGVIFLSCLLLIVLFVALTYRASQKHQETLELVAVYSQKLEVLPDANILNQKLLTFSALKSSTIAVASSKVDVRALLGVLERLHPNGLKITSLEFDSEDNFCQLEIDAANESIVDELLSTLDASGELKGTSVLKKRMAEDDPDRVYYKIEVRL